MIIYIISSLILISPILIIIPKTFTIFNLLMLMLLGIYSIYKMDYKTLIALSITIILATYNYTLIIKYIAFQNVKDLNMYCMSLFLLVLIIGFITNEENYVYLSSFIFRRKKILLCEVIIIEFVELLYLITGKGFVSRWDGSYFSGNYDTPHPFAYYMILIILIIAYLYNTYKNYFVNFLLVIPITLILLTGARTPTIGGLAIAAIIYYKYIPKKLMLTITALISLFLLFGNKEVLINKLSFIPLVQKFMTTSSTNSLLNGRDKFWSFVLDSFMGSNLHNQILGHGIYYSKVINFYNYGMLIWAHNDFLDITTSFGILGLLICIYCWIRYFLYLGNKNGFFSLGLAGIYFLLSFTNGTINYTHFFLTYFYLLILKESINKNTYVNKKDVIV